MYVVPALMSTLSEFESESLSSLSEFERISVLCLHVLAKLLIPPCLVPEHAGTLTMAARTW